jgi:hypothetical protein
MSFMRANSRERWAVAVLSVTLSASGHAAAQSSGPAAPAEAPPSDEKAVCIGAFDQAQVERAASHFLESQKQLLVCSRPVCGNALMAECTQMYTDIDRAIPSVVLSAHDEARNVDLTAVDVSVDGHPFTQVLDGKPHPVDPGEYEFVFSVPGREPVRRSLVVGTGDKYRQVQVVFPALDPAARRAPSAAASIEADAAPSGRGVPTMSFVLGGIGIAGFGTFAGLRIVGNNDFDDMQRGCAPTCAESDVSDLRQKFVLSNVALGVGAGATAGALLWYLLAPSGTSSMPVTLAPSGRGQGVIASTKGTF